MITAAEAKSLSLDLEPINLAIKEYAEKGYQAFQVSIYPYGGDVEDRPLLELIYNNMNELEKLGYTVKLESNWGQTTVTLSWKDK